MLDPVKLADGVWPLAPARVLRRQFLWWRAVLDPNPYRSTPESSRLTKSWATGHHGRHARGRPETQVVSDQPVSLQDGCPRRAVEQTPIVGPDRCRGPARVARGLSIRPARGGDAVSECRGQPRRLLLVPGRGRHAPEELPRPAKNLTRPPGVDSPVDTGG